MGAGERPPEAGLETAVSGPLCASIRSPAACTFPFFNACNMVTESRLFLRREEQDFEYARLIQEEILRCAEEAQRREQDDEVSTNSWSQINLLWLMQEMISSDRE